MAGGPSTPAHRGCSMTPGSPSVWAMLIIAMTCSVVSAEDRAAEEFFEKEVRPILAAKCLECHG